MFNVGKLKRMGRSTIFQWMFGSLIKEYLVQSIYQKEKMALVFF